MKKMQTDFAFIPLKLLILINLNMRTIKEELFWIQAWESITAVQSAFAQLTFSYNNGYLHSTLG